MAVTSRSWPDEILHLTRERERDERDTSEQRWKRERKKEVCGKRRSRGKGPEKEVNDEAEEEAEGGRCESSALTLGFDARP